MLQHSECSDLMVLTMEVGPVLQVITLLQVLKTKQINKQKKTLKILLS